MDIPDSTLSAVTVHSEDAGPSSPPTPSSLIVQIDTREHAFIEKWKSLNLADASWDVQIVPLEIGDIQILYPDRQIRFIFERKTFCDLAASIKDGRYREQKARLLANYSPIQITYLLEDINTHLIFCPKSSSQRFFGLTKSAFESFLLHSRYRDGVHLHCSAGIEETVRYVMELARRIQAHPEIFSSVVGNANRGEQPNYIETCAIKSCKRENITPLVCFQLQLGQIPGISSGIAKTICQHVSSMNELIGTLRGFETVSERLKWLQTIPSLGKKKAETIYAYLGLGI